MAALSGLSFDEFLRTFDRANLLPLWPGPSGRKGAAFPVVAARLLADRMIGRFRFDRTVVLLGKRTAAAFGLSVGYFEPVMIGRATVLVVPHPSGVNRWFNEPANVRRMARFMRRIVRQ